MRPIIFVVLLAGCGTRNHIVHSYPSGMTIVRVRYGADLNRICNATHSDSWRLLSNDQKSFVGCYDQANDVIYVQNNNDGAMALVHELAHREGIADPGAAGYDW